MRSDRSGIVPVALLFAALTALAPALADAAGIHCAMTPAVSMVQPGETFTLDFSITSADASFNGFDAVVEYDPAALTFLPTAPTALQQGTLMTGACGSTFHLFSSAADSMAFTSVILCAGVSQTGPGQLYELSFQAGPSYTDTWVRLRPTREKFFDAGIRVTPVETADALVHIMDLTGVPGTPATGLSLRAAPNPARVGSTFVAVADVDGPQSLAIYDLRGRIVRRFDAADAQAGPRSVPWDGLDDRGVKLAPGVYRAVLRSAGRSASTPLVVVP